MLERTTIDQTLRLSSSSSPSRSSHRTSLELPGIWMFLPGCCLGFLSSSARSPVSRVARLPLECVRCGTPVASHGGSGVRGLGPDAGRTCFGTWPWAGVTGMVVAVVAVPTTQSAQGDTFVAHVSPDRRWRPPTG